MFTFSTVQLTFLFLCPKTRKMKRRLTELVSNVEEDRLMVNMVSQTPKEVLALIFGFLDIENIKLRRIDKFFLQTISSI